jgi:hypothetical protein
MALIEDETGTALAAFPGSIERSCRTAESGSRMTLERWRELDTIYHSHGSGAGVREAYIAEVCGSDEDPRREVEWLLMLDASPVSSIGRLSVSRRITG